MMARQKQQFRSVERSSACYSIIKCKGKRQLVAENDFFGTKFSQYYSLPQDQDIQTIFSSAYYQIPIKNIGTFFVCFFACSSTQSTTSFQLTLEPSTRTPLSLRFFIDKVTWQNLSADLLLQNIAKELKSKSKALNSQLQKQQIIPQNVEPEEVLALFTRCFYLKPGTHILLLQELASIHQNHLEKIYQLLQRYSLHLKRIDGEFFVLEIGQIYEYKNQPQPYPLPSELIHTFTHSLTIDITHQPIIWSDFQEVYHNQLKKGIISLFRYIKDQRTLLQIKFSSAAQAVGVVRLLLQRGVGKSIHWNKARLCCESESFKQMDNMLQLNRPDNKDRLSIPSFDSIALYKNIIQVLKEGSINALRRHWNMGLASFLDFMLRLDSYQLSATLEQLLLLLFHIVDYKLARYNINFSTDDSRKTLFFKPAQGKGRKKGDYYDPGNNLFEKLYPGIYKLFKVYFQKVKGCTFWEGWQAYKNEIQKRDKNVNLSKLPQSYHEEFLNEFIIHENCIDERLEQYLLNLIKGNKDFKSIAFQLDPSLNDRQTLTESFCWKDTLSLVEYQVMKFKKDNPIKQSKLNYLAQLQNQKLVENGCLGCAQFFFEDFDIMGHSVIRIPLIAFDSVRNLRNIETQIKQSICALLNSKGGIILFGCQRGSLSVNTIGQEITEIEKEQYQQQIAFFTQSFYPKLQIKQNIELTFVPIKENPYKISTPKLNQIYAGEIALYKGDETFRKREFIKGRFAARLRICPSKDVVYCWKNEEDRYFSAIEIENKVTRLTINRMIKELKRRTKNKLRRYQLQSHSNSDSDKAVLLEVPRNCFQHTCSQPENGHKIPGRQDKPKILKQSNEDRFKYMTMMVFRSKHIKEVENKFRELQIECVIRPQFQNLNLYHSKDTAVMYHNIHFSELLRLTANNKSNFILDGKNLLIISITEYIRIVYNEESLRFPLDEARMQYYQSYLAAVIPGETIRYYIYHTPQKKEFYAQATTKRGNLLMFYVLNEHRIKTIFKSPNNLAILSDSQKKKLWQEVKYRPSNLF